MNKTFILITLILLALQIDTLAQQINLIDSCASDYDESVDYFPEKVEITDAENFSVDYFNHYKVVTVSDAFDGADPFTYVLVQCGTPAPDAANFPTDTQFIEVPTEGMIALSTTQLPHLVELDLLDSLLGLDTFLYVNTPQVNEMIADGDLIEVGSGTSVNTELILDSQADMVMTFAYSAATNAHPVLTQAGIFTAINAEWREATPLGRAEWLKYMALFYNAEAEAEQIYSDIVSAYDDARELANSIPEEERPTVLWNSFSNTADAWRIPGRDTYAGALIQDAGGRIALGDTVPPESALLGFETVYDGAFDADIWITNAYGITSLDAFLGREERYAYFSAIETENIWNNTLDINQNGGNNYFELGVTNPHLILQDLVAIFHPELMPDHEFTFYMPLIASEEE
ncbi:MAG: ABC transporter substrate-binding protein [Chloroflexota bacterium]